MRILMTGATGFIGRALVDVLLAKGHTLLVLTRNPGKAEASLPPNCRVWAWDGKSDHISDKAMAGVEGVVHLAGENLAGVWTPKKKAAVRESRVLGTRGLVQALGQAGMKPKVFVAASAVGIYGDGGEGWLTEADPPGSDFMARVTVDWEKEIFRARESGMRAVAIRNGVVLGKGGALKKMQLPFRLGLGAVLGSGRQYFPWIHLYDTLGIYLLALENEAVEGPLNGCAPTPVTQAEFSRSLARALNRPLFLKVPGIALKAALGDLAKLLLYSQKVSTAKVEGLGYRFRFPEINAALKGIFET